MNYFEMEPMRYWNMPSSMSKDDRRERLDVMISAGTYIFSRKYDGNWARAVITKDRQALQTRGISKVTGTYGENQDKVFFWDSICNAFSEDTVILGEIYLEGGIDKDVGSILRSGVHKARSIQDEDYYNEIRKKVKFTAKDRRDIEGNKFRNQKLSFRIFDVLVYNGENIMDMPNVERVKLIPEVVAKINNPLVRGLKYHEMDETFFEKLSKIFAQGGEGVVLYRKNAKYVPGKRGPSSWDTIKIKQELSTEIDCFIIGTEPAAKNYTGDYLNGWKYWYDIKTDERLYGDYYLSYVQGNNSLIPITKGYYHEWPGAIKCGVYADDGSIYEICKVAGLEESFKEDLKNNYNKWHMCPLTISGMMLSSTNDGVSVRHPIIKTIRQDDMDAKDCTLNKIVS